MCICSFWSVSIERSSSVVPACPAAAGTLVALGASALVGSIYGFMSVTDFISEAHRLLATWTPATHPLKFAPFVNAYRALGFMLATICISHACATWMKGGRPQPRHVPLIITWAVVISCLVVLVLDWGFSQLFVHINDAAGSADHAGAFHATLGADGPDDHLDDHSLSMRTSHTVADDESSADSGPSSFPAPSGWAEQIDDEL